MFRTTVRRWSSRTRETWLSVLSWMRWLLTAPQRRRAARRHREQALLLEALQRALRPQEEALLRLHRDRERERVALLEALRALERALGRQDSLLQEEMRRTRVQAEAIREQQQELLMEVLASLQPPAETQLLPLLGSTRPPSHASLVR